MHGSHTKRVVSEILSISHHSELGQFSCFSFSHCRRTCFYSLKKTIYLLGRLKWPYAISNIGMSYVVILASIEKVCGPT